MPKSEAAKWRAKYTSQRDKAKIRGIEWKLTFEEWDKWWVDSGHKSERGRFRGNYCMARIGDTGPYEIGNIFCALFEVNSGDACRGRTFVRTPEHVAKITASRIRNKKPIPPRTPELRALMSEKRKAWCAANPDKLSFERSPEHCAKISEMATNRWKDPEQRKAAAERTRLSWLKRKAIL